MLKKIVKMSIDLQSFKKAILTYKLLRNINITILKSIEILRSFRVFKDKNSTYYSFNEIINFESK